MMKQLKNVVKNAQLNERYMAQLREEISSSISNRIAVEDRPIDEVCADALYEVTSLRNRGQDVPQLKVGTLIKMCGNTSPVVRRLAAALLPEGQLTRLAQDRSWEVRSEVAARIPLAELKAMVRRFPGDLNIRQVYDDRLDEALKITPQRNPYWTEASIKRIVSDADSDPPLTDAWYTNLATYIFNEFRSPVNPPNTVFAETYGVYRMADLFVKHSKSTSGVDIDGEKLKKAIEEQIEDYEDQVMKRYGLDEVLERLEQKSVLEETVLFGGYEPDEVEELFETRLTNLEFRERVEELFKVCHGGLRISRADFDILIAEGIKPAEVSVPLDARLPRANIRPVDERALDRYVGIWNERSERSGSPIRIDWAHDEENVWFRVSV